MSDLRTERLVLHPVDVHEARRVAGQEPDDSDRWAHDYPFGGDVIAATVHLHATEQLGDQRPWGYYQIVRAEDGVTIGGIGFKGAPEHGRAEVGYGLAPSARGQGYTAEALTALLAVAREHGVRRVLADTDADNLASRRTLERAGFTLIRTSNGLCDYSVDL